MYIFLHATLSDMKKEIDFLKGDANFVVCQWMTQTEGWMKCSIKCKVVAVFN
jgi:hypothetical protein